MTPKSTDIQKLAQRLIALETTRDPSDGSIGAAARACDAMRARLAKLIGVAGFRSLISRSLALAKAEAPSLDPVRVGLDGALEGLDEIVDQPGDDPGAVIVVELLGLLATFIGEALTLRLARDAWPEAFTDHVDPTVEATP